MDGRLSGRGTGTGVRRGKAKGRARKLDAYVFVYVSDNLSLGIPCVADAYRGGEVRCWGNLGNT